MPGRQHAERLWISLLQLGARRLAMLGAIGLAVFLIVGAGAYFLSRPAQETLYTGLDREDVSRMGVVLKDANIAFDVSSDGTALLVSYGNTAQARMLLAEKGLPHSTKSGYELFNDLGSLGLTSFMQEVTKVRALEGELARTIQAMKGVKAARVHIVLPDRGSFRREQQVPSASVVIRTTPSDDRSAAQAIRHLVAAAIPGMKVEKVTVMNTDGILLMSGDDAANVSTGKLANLEKTVGSEIQNAVRRTLAPYLGIGNFEISVAARLNTDKINTSETIFDPESKVERSIRTVKEVEVSQNRQGQKPTTVQQNLPDQNVRADGSENSSEDNQRREELTNFEISSKTIQTVSDGYSIKDLSVAVLVNKTRLATLVGENAAPSELDAKIIEIEQLVSSAAGFNKARGDQIKVAAVGFIEGSDNLQPVPGPSWTEILGRQLGTFINAVTILALCVLMIWFGLRPAVKMLVARQQAEIEYQKERAAALLAQQQAETLALQAAEIESERHARLEADPLPKLIEGNTPQRMLEHIVDFNEEQAALVLKQWLMQPEAA
ncbi:flagellar basal-body MS-ring/collar protein FliF [Microvirga brassicacearum]|uniref:Flagellar M-ring protein n=1 Tax=Microvirga brassicacearum TaxID=2580413 RepID=A0A5N3P3N1_9HYPH|nr:flagellar basal-body MS-ring/collar protein FliF [Microvirga brassicacearum]KAB0264335.1 flagellar M-ring protein FliF [Microvirga brassicacearum]